MPNARTSLDGATMHAVGVSRDTRWALVVPGTPSLSSLCVCWLLLGAFWRRFGVVFAFSRSLKVPLVFALWICNGAPNST